MTTAVHHENIELLDPIVPEESKKLPEQFKRWSDKVKKARLITDPKKERKTREEIVQKWHSLVKNVKHEVVDFIGLHKQKARKEHLVKKWELRSKYLYANNLLFSNVRRSLPVCQLDGKSARHRAGVKTGKESLTTIDAEGIDEPDIGMDHSEIDTIVPSKLTGRIQETFHKSKDSVAKIVLKALTMPENLKQGANKIRSFIYQIQLEYKEHHVGRYRQLDVEFFEQPVSTGFGYPKELTSSQPQIYDEGSNLVDSSKAIYRFEKLKNGFYVHKPDDRFEMNDTVFGGKRIMSKLLEELQNNAKRQVGVGFFGRCIINSEQDRSYITDDAKKQLDELEDNSHRPYFTYWVTFVQIMCFIVAVSVYGIAPWGFQETMVDAEVLTSRLSIEIVHYMEKDNLWIGPRQADLIHLGARYSPCMRKDDNVYKAILGDRIKENSTACCIQNDISHCVQTPASLCSTTLSTWLNSSYYSVDENRKSGTVCGQDPQFCIAPASHAPYIWPDEIIKWPICTKKSEIGAGAPEHMKCNIAGRPCCIGIQGECVITTREHCTFVRGYFHEEATLCAQITCLSETCGMLPFHDPDRPDQFYRLWTSLFIHAGLLQLIISVGFQMLIMKDVEKFIGWFRICLIYIMSGIAGSLASAIFIPYHVEAGPSGSQYGIIACIFVEIIQNWEAINAPGLAIAKFGGILLFLFVIGLLPMIDNYAHLVGFVFGFLLSFALMPHVDFNIQDERMKNIAICVCLFGSIGLFLLLVVFFYVIPIYSCKYCHFLSCIPLTSTFCQSMEVKIRRVD